METNNLKKYRGFTFVELIIVISIIGIMTAVGFVSYQSAKNDSRLKAAQREVAAAIKSAQSYALQGKTAPDGKTPCGYGFRFLDASNYEIFYNPGSDCKTENESAAQRQWISLAATPRLESSSLNNGVVLKDITGVPFNSPDTEIYFTVPFGNIYNKGGASFSQKIFKFEYPTGGNTKTITIAVDGNITEE